LDCVSCADASFTAGLDEPREFLSLVHLPTSMVPTLLSFNCAQELACLFGLASHDGRALRADESGLRLFRLQSKLRNHSDTKDGQRGFPLPRVQVARACMGRRIQLSTLAKIRLHKMNSNHRPGCAAAKYAVRSLPLRLGHDERWRRAHLFPERPILLNPPRGVRGERIAHVDGRFIPGLNAISSPMTNWQGEIAAAATLFGTHKELLEPGSLTRVANLPCAIRSFLSDSLIMGA
jgi:hypothetical protein